MVIQDTALKGRAKRPFLICVTAEAAEVPAAHAVAAAGALPAIKRWITGVLPKSSTSSN